MRRDVVSQAGEFLLQPVAPGKYFVSVKGKTGGEEFREIEILGGQETEAVFELKSLCNIEGIVLGQYRHPLEGIMLQAIKMRELRSTPKRVWVFHDPGRYEYDRYPQLTLLTAVRSGPDGRFVLENLEQTEYRIIATRIDNVTDPHGRWYSVFADVTPQPEISQLLELVLPRGTGRIEGCVVGEGGARNYVEVALIGSGQTIRVHSDRQGNYFFEDVLPGRYHVRAQIWGQGHRRYEGREIELAEGERLHLDIAAEGGGATRGSISFAGEAARAYDWCYGQKDLILVLRGLKDTGLFPSRETRVRVTDTFELQNIPRGTYEATAYAVFNIKPLGHASTNYPFRKHYKPGDCRARFVSQPQIVEVAPGSSTPISLTVSEACAAHYPIPDSETCDRSFIFKFP